MNTQYQRPNQEQNPKTEVGAKIAKRMRVISQGVGNVLQIIPTSASMPPEAARLPIVSQIEYKPQPSLKVGGMTPINSSVIKNVYPVPTADLQPAPVANVSQNVLPFTPNVQTPISSTQQMIEQARQSIREAV